MSCGCKAEGVFSLFLERLELKSPQDISAMGDAVSTH